MMKRSRHLRTARWGLLKLVVIGLAATAGAQAATAQTLEIRLMAAQCFACHGPQGRSAGVTRTLQGVDEDRLMDFLTAYRNDTRQGTIMNRIAKGYSVTELESIAAYLEDLGD